LLEQRIFLLTMRQAQQKAQRIINIQIKNINVLLQRTPRRHGLLTIKCDVVFNVKFDYDWSVIALA